MADYETTAGIGMILSFQMFQFLVEVGTSREVAFAAFVGGCVWSLGILMFKDDWENVRSVLPGGSE